MIGDLSLVLELGVHSLTTSRFFLFLFLLILDSMQADARYLDRIVFRVAFSPISSSLLSFDLIDELLDWNTFDVSLIGISSSLVVVHLGVICRWFIH